MPADGVPGLDGHEFLPSSVEPRTLIIEADPSDEIREAWEEMRTFLSIACWVFVLVCAMLYLVLRHSLGPLAQLLAAFEHLERDDFSTRVSESRPRARPDPPGVQPHGRGARDGGAAQSSHPEGHFEVSIEDDGKGIAAGVRFGLGLTGLSERIHALGGRLTVTPRERGGTRVHAWLPLTLDPRADEDE